MPSEQEKVLEALIAIVDRLRDGVQEEPEIVESAADTSFHGIRQQPFYIDVTCGDGVRSVSVVLGLDGVFLCDEGDGKDVVYMAGSDCALSVKCDIVGEPTEEGRKAVNDTLDVLIRGLFSQVKESVVISDISPEPAETPALLMSAPVILKIEIDPKKLHEVKEALLAQRGVEGQERERPGITDTSKYETQQVTRNWREGFENKKGRQHRDHVHSSDPDPQKRR